MMRVCRTPFLCLVVTLAAGLSQAAGLRVSPAQFIIHDVEPGRVYDIFKETGLRLTIYNEGDKTLSWMLSTHRPSERGRWEKGYSEIPDAKWCWFDQTDVSSGPDNPAYGHLFIQIPEDPKYYNQHWVATLSVRGRPGAGPVSLAVDIRVQIETKTVNDATTVPDGALAFVPSEVVYVNAQPGLNRQARVRIFNNDSTAHNYTVTSLFDDDSVDHKSYLTGGYRKIPEASWLDRPQTIQIGAGQSYELVLNLTVPQDAAHYGRKWEDIVLVQPDKGLAGFVRVKIETREKAELP